jgi:hypothetical protein
MLEELKREIDFALKQTFIFTFCIAKSYYDS